MKKAGREDDVKCTTMRLAEIMDIYAKLKDVNLFDDPDVAPLKEACQRYVRDAESARGSVKIRALGRKLKYDLRRRAGQATYAMIKGDADDDSVGF